MKTWVRKTLSVGVLAAGALLFAPGTANADVWQSSGDNNGILNGTQLAVPVQVPTNIVGNSLGILGVADSHAAGANFIESGSGGQSNGNNNGILNGTRVFAPITAPINACGNSFALLGGANSHALCGNSGAFRSARTFRGHRAPVRWPRHANNGILNGTTIAVPIDLSTNYCGNALGFLGSAGSNAACFNDDPDWDFIANRRYGHSGFGHSGLGSCLCGDGAEYPAADDYGYGNQKPVKTGYGHQKPVKTGYGHPKPVKTGQKPVKTGYGDEKPAKNDDKPVKNNDKPVKNGQKPVKTGYGDEKPATPGYGGQKPVAAGSDTGSTGGRDRGEKDESAQVAGATQTVAGVSDGVGFAGLGLLDTLR
ncbi:hypothetical protein GCM10010172_54070 [Paractinoplanes ferrugineus]|uniref:Chaplin domain-containing protein n=1 Tax=Paractinoplanes ferrugineus TaxID=113564 RepID=A0A919MGM4_9ACTN|nr:chaplin family protein [Actinoplanes ferrugineus]GIE11775.1 hypothetical protein Afe05nite_36150 [Actinoplanes ferrugineus]